VIEIVKKLCKKLNKAKKGSDVASALGEAAEAIVGDEDAGRVRDVSTAAALKGAGYAEGIVMDTGEGAWEGAGTLAGTRNGQEAWKIDAPRAG